MAIQIENKETKKPLTAAEKAEADLKSKLGIELISTSLSRISNIANRDRSYNSYMSGFVPFGMNRVNNAIVLDGIDIGFVTSKSGIPNGADQKIGEIGMIGIAPALRQKGIGTLIDSLIRMRLVEEGIDELVSMEADETGTIVRLNQQLGLTKTNQTLIDGTPKWVLSISHSNKQAVLKKLTAIFDENLIRLSPAELVFDPNEVDRDNPARESVLAALQKRLGPNMDMPDESDLYGYPGSAIQISQEKESRGFRYVMQVKGSSMNAFEELVEKGFEVFPYPTTLLIDGYGAASPLFSDDQKKPNLQMLANFGQKLFNQIHTHE